jgi:hypothetical protein
LPITGWGTNTVAAFGSPPMRFTERTTLSNMLVWMATHGTP